MRYPGFIGGAYQSASKLAAADRCVNWYPEKVESGTGKNEFVLYPTPGMIPFGAVGSGPTRGMLAAGAPLTGLPRLFVVSGTGLYEVFSNGTSTLLGSVVDDFKPAQLFPNGNQLGIVSGEKFYLDNGAGPVAVNFTLGGPVTARTGAFIDGYFIVNPPDSKQIFISALNDGTSWDPLDTATKEGYPDNIAAIIADHEELWLVGEETTEVWHNTGNPDFPFGPLSGGFIQTGTIASFSVTRLGSYGVGWLAHDNRGGYQAVRCEGFLPRRVSTHAVEQIWEKYTETRDVISYTYNENGHQFWVLVFPNAGAAWCLDLTTGLWHERGWWNGTAFATHRARCHQWCFGKHLVGDRENGTIFQMSSEIYTDPTEFAFGTPSPIHRIRTAPHLSGENTNTFYHRLKLDYEGAVGDVKLRWSNDGGKTFGAQLSGSVNGLDSNIAFRRLGKARDRVFEVEVISDEKVALIDAYLDLTPGVA